MSWSCSDCDESHPGRFSFCPVSGKARPREPAKVLMYDTHLPTGYYQVRDGKIFRIEPFAASPKSPIWAELRKASGADG